MHARPSYPLHHLVGQQLLLQLELLDFVGVPDLLIAGSSFGSVSHLTAIVSSSTHFRFLVI